MAEKTLYSRIIHKHDTAANWLQTNFIPKQGEFIVYDIDADYNYERFKIGDGKTNINSLPFADGALRDYVDAEIAELSDDVDALNTLVGDTSVSSQITSAIANKADAGHNHDDIYYTESEIDDKLSAKADAEHTHAFDTVSVSHASTADTANAVAWENVTGKPESYAAEDHDHAISDVTDLQTTLDAKVPTTRTVNGKALSDNITLSASDVGADVSGAADAALTNANNYTDAQIAAMIGDDTVANQIGGAISALEEQIIAPTFYVTFTRQTDTTYTANKTYAEVEAAYVAGQNVIGLLDLGLDMLYHIPMLYCVTSYAMAFHTNLESSDPITIAYGADGTIVVQTYAKIASKTDVSDAIAAIEYPVKSVNSKTGVVVLSASDVGADASGAASTALTSAKSYTDTQLSAMVGDDTVANQISAAVDAIDHPVDSVNGKTGAVELTAADVGADVWYVTVTENDDDTFSADKTFAEILAAHETGATVCCTMIIPNSTTNASLIMPLAGYTDEALLFTAWLDHYLYFVYITESEISYNYKSRFPCPGFLTIKLGDEVLCSYNGDDSFEYETIASIPAEMPNPNALTFTGAVSATYDGSGAVTVEIPDSVETDTSLSVSGQAADAKATGDAIAALDTLVGDTAVATQIGEAIATKADIAAGVYTVTATSDDGVAYAATVPGIDALVSGVSFIMVPAVVSDSLSPTIDVNGLGAKPIRRRLSNLATALQNGYTVNWLTANAPFTLVYDGTAWVVEGLTKPVGADLYGAASKAKADADGNVITDTYATKSRAATITIPASAWIKMLNSYRVNVDCEIATASNNLIISLAAQVSNSGGVTELISLDTYEAAAAAKIMASGQGDGMLSFLAYGEKPTVDIPVLVMEVG